MERVRPLMVVVAGLVFATAGTGCVTVDPTSKSVKLSVAPETPPPPATQLLCMWQRRITPLQDPVNDGKKIFGLPGQMFLLARDGAPAEIMGDLAIMVFDETRRPNGVAPHQPEYWHFTKDVLKRLVTSDERFGRTYALFLPWPPHWKDVTTVRIGARYIGHDKLTDLSAEDARMTLDLKTDAPAWSLVGAGQPGANVPMQHSMYDQFGVPDPTKLMQQARGGAAPPATQPTGFVAPQQQPPPGWPPPGQVQPAGGVQAPIQPLAPPQLPPGGPAPPIPLPARSW